MDAQRRKVLLVEDDPDHVMLIRGALRRTPSWDVVADCHDLDVARELAAAHQPAVTLVDLHLGPQSGRDLVGHLIVDHPLMMVVALSAEPAETARAELFDLGAFGYLEKSPALFRSDRLGRALDSLLEAFSKVIDGGTETTIPLALPAFS